MNAPWSVNAASGSSVPQDNFMAFMADDAALKQIKPVIKDLGWSDNKLFAGGVRNAVQTLSVSASPKILLVDLGEAGDPMTEINSLAEVCEPGTVVVVIGNTNDGRLYRTMLASGIHDYLPRPLEPDTLRESLLMANAALNAAPAASVQEDTRHRSIAVIGVRGGVGTSTIASSLAWLYAEEQEIKTAILDLDVHFGVGALSFDLEPGRGLTDAIENPSRVDSLFIERAIVKCGENLSVLSAEAPVTMPLLADGSALQHLCDELRGSFPQVIVDLPRTIAVQTPHLLTEIDDIILVSDLTLAATRDTIRMLGFIQSAAPNARVWTVLNKIGATATENEVQRKEFEASIERQVSAVLPLEIKAATLAAKQGKPITAGARTSKLGQALNTLHLSIAAAEGKEATARASLMDKFPAVNALMLKLKAATEKKPKQDKKKK